MERHSTLFTEEATNAYVKVDFTEESLITAKVHPNFPSAVSLPDPTSFPHNSLTIHQ